MSWRLVGWALNATPPKEPSRANAGRIAEASHLREPDFGEWIGTSSVPPRRLLARQPRQSLDPPSRSLAQSRSRRSHELRQSAFAIVHVEPDLSIRRVPAGHSPLASAIAQPSRDHQPANRTSLLSSGGHPNRRHERCAARTPWRSGRHLEAAMRRPRRQERAWRAIYKCRETEHLPSQSDKSLRTIQLLTRSRSFGMGLFIEKPKQGRLVSSRLVSLYCLNPARPSAPTRHTRQRIKTPMCRLGIQSEQTSDTHQLAAAAASSRHRPRSCSLLQRSPPTGFAKKNSGDAASRACVKHKPVQADAVSDADSMHWRFFGSRGRPKSPCVKPAPFQMQIQCTRDHHRAAAAASGRRPPLGPASGQRRPCIRKKIQRGPRRPRTTRANG